MCFSLQRESVSCKSWLLQAAPPALLLLLRLATTAIDSDLRGWEESGWETQLATKGLRHMATDNET